MCDLDLFSKFQSFIENDQLQRAPNLMYKSTYTLGMSLCWLICIAKCSHDQDCYIHPVL